MDEMISRQLLDLWNKYKPTIAVDAIEYDRELRQLLSTNLASLGTDCISRQSAIDALWKALFEYEDETEKQFQERDDLDVGDWIGKYRGFVQNMSDIDRQVILNMPPAEPKIIYCKDCRKHNKRIGDYVEKSDGTYDWIWKDQACPLAEFRGVAQGHEFDYQFCAYGERRTE